MKTTFITTMALLVYWSSSAQLTEKVKEKMLPFQNWAGHWKGEGSMRMGPGDPKKSIVDETIEVKLDGTIVVVEGIGKSIDEGTGEEFVSHHAFATLYFDPETDSYRFNTHLKDGRSTDAWFTITGKNAYQWGFDSPQGKIQYSITLDLEKNTWKETGAFSRDGTSWMPFFEMNLTRVDQ